MHNPVTLVMLLRLLPRETQVRGFLSNKYCKFYADDADDEDDDDYDDCC